jgi:sulfotransferase|tara:strand:- start:299 stop:1420 length:1122 start_codon:yes stop_codon:yes gene_type:complete
MVGDGGLEMIFLASLPRSGSTLLTSLLNQRPDVYASPTSNLCNILNAAKQVWDQSAATKADGGKESDIIRILRSIQDARYETDKLVLDKARNWCVPETIKTMIKVQGDAKIVATVRPVAECLASFAKLINPENIMDFCKRHKWAQHLFDSYENMQAGYKEYPNNFLLIEYDDLVSNPQVQLNRIAKFIGIDPFIYDFNNIEDSKEIDEVWGVEGLHKVRKKVSKRTYSARKILGKSAWNLYQGGEFWNDKPLLNDKGREVSAWGNASEKTAFLQNVDSNQPVWNGEKNAVVLLHLQRGLKDQISQVRYARELKKLGCTVVVSCTQTLAEKLRHADGVDVVVQHEVSSGVYHDFYLPAMSAPIQLGYQNSADIA